jgi:hypothetical protein
VIVAHATPAPGSNVASPRPVRWHCIVSMPLRGGRGILKMQETNVPLKVQGEDLL